MFGYVTRGEMLLVFHHRDFPLQEVGVQVPSGTVESGESPEQAAVREVREEAGLVNLRLIRYLGAAEYDVRPGRHEVHERHFFHFTGPDDIPDEWLWFEEHDGVAAPTAFLFSWLPLTKARPRSRYGCPPGVYRTGVKATLRARARAATEDVDMDCPPELRLAAIDEHNWHASLAVRVSPDQLRFVAGYQPVALVILAKAYVRPGDLGWEPLALTLGTSVVGVLALAHARTHTELLHLAIDVTEQGRGVGAAAVALVLAHVAQTRPACDEVRLTVHPDNGRAQRLYRSVGFSPTGQIRDGEPLWSLSLKRHPVLPAPEDQE